MRNKFEGHSAKFQGDDVEMAYVEVFGWKKASEYEDKDLGQDLITNNPEVPRTQAKSSIEIALKFLKESMRRSIREGKSKFVPLCIGDPGNDEKAVFESLRKFGVWIGSDVRCDRESFLKQVASWRELCYNGGRLEGLAA
jgi:hypothetical protein